MSTSLTFHLKVLSYHVHTLLSNQNDFPDGELFTNQWLRYQFWGFWYSWDPHGKHYPWLLKTYSAPKRIHRSVHTYQGRDRQYISNRKKLLQLDQVEMLRSPQNMQEMPLLVGNRLNASSAHHIIYAQIHLTLQAAFIRSFSLILAQRVVWGLNQDQLTKS